MGGLDNLPRRSSISGWLGELSRQFVKFKMSRMEVLRLFKMRDAIGLFLVALDASEIPQSKQEVFIFTITMATVVLLQAECDEGWREIKTLWDMKRLDTSWQSPSCKGYFNNCTAWPPVWLFFRGCDGGQAVLKRSILTTIISWSEVVKTLQKELYISTTCRNSWSYSKRCFGYSWTGTRRKNSWKMLIGATKGFSDHIITQVRHDGWWRLLCL